jgi:nucleotide-binding universal stress UspA family protein
VTIFVAYEPSPAGRQALIEGAAWARDHRRPLHVARVIVHEAGGESPVRARADMKTAWDVEERLEQLQRELADDGIETTTAVLHSLQGDTARTLLDAAREVQAELIVVGVRQRSRVGKLVLGSVAQDLVLEARCPVLAVKAPVES